MTTTRVSFYTQGCRLNQSETAVMEYGFTSDDQFQVVDFKDPAEIVIVNTCTVTENGDADTRRLANKIQRINPGAKVALVGCQAQILKEQLLKLPGIQWVIGNSDKMNIKSIVQETLSQEKPPEVRVEKLTKKTFTVKDPGIDEKHTRANIKIQDGCDFYCAFCVIPFARGPARSREYGDIFREVQSLVEAGHKEIVVTGINVGTYENEGKNIVDVLKGMIKVPGLERIRISSIEPTTIPWEVIEMMRDEPKICRYLHIPLQSGTDKVLTLMNRKYDIATFLAFIKKAEQIVPDICIGTDVIVGFPGEDDTSFEETEQLLKDAPIHYFHVFSYSERMYARSKKLPGQVPLDVIKKRSERLRALSLRKRRLFWEAQLGKEVSVLYEQKKNGYWTGLTDNYLKIKTESNLSLENKMGIIRIGSITDSGLVSKN